MTHSRPGIVLIIAALLMVVFATTATAAQRLPSTLTLTIQGPEGGRRTAQLVCDPSGGSHPNPAAACAAIAAAGGNLSALKPEPLFCTLEFRPVTASASGAWRGRIVRWRQEYGNPCGLRAATGTVFAF